MHPILCLQLLFQRPRLLKLRLMVQDIQIAKELAYVDVSTEVSEVGHHLVELLLPSHGVNFKSVSLFLQYQIETRSSRHLFLFLLD